jgi:acid phosphatase
MQIGNILISLFFLLSATLGAAEAAVCPAPVQSHIPPVPPAPLNIDIVKDLLLDYYTKYYDDDVAAVFDSARAFVEENADRSKRLALVLDIDETSLSNWPNLSADNFGFIPDGACNRLPAGPCGFNEWILKSIAAPIPPALLLFKAARGRGIAVFFITGRRDKQRQATLWNLDRAGFEGWTKLVTRPDRDDFPTVQAYKIAERAKIEAEGYAIIANVGDQDSDLAGDHAQCTFKVPNPFYFIR